MNRKKLFICSLFLGLLALSGCTLSTSGSRSNDGGVWRSTDSGATVLQTVKVPAIDGKVITISNVEVTDIAVDPSDHQTIYLGSKSNGIIYSYDGGSSWRQFRDLTKGYVNSVAVDPKNKCVIYATVSNKLHKTVDCGRTWQNPYFHQKAEVYLTDIDVSPANTNTLLMGNSEGELIKSTNGGQSWKTVLRVKSGSIMDVIIDPNNNQIAYVGTEKEGIYKSLDGGETWTELSEGLKSYSGTHEYKKLVVAPATADTLIFISKFGMLRSSNGGLNWEVVDLLPGPKETVIHAVAVDPKNSREIYYATASTLVKSIDGGQTWSSGKLPYSRATSNLTINPSDTKILYLGTSLPPKK